MPEVAGPYTVEMLEEFPSDGNRYEIIDGALIVTPSPQPPHQAVQMRLVRQILPYVDAHALGEIWAGPTGVIFDRQTVLEPDLMVVLGKEVSKLKSWKDLPDPALVVEILSPSSAKYDRGAKRERYLRRTAEYWIVDIDSRSIERWRPGNRPPLIARETLSWQPVASVPPLSVDVKAVFAEL